MVLSTIHSGVRSFGVPPVGALDLTPPRCRRDTARGREVVREQPGEDERPAPPFGLRAVTGGVDELGELPVGHGGA